MEPTPDQLARYLVAMPEELSQHIALMKEIQAVIKAAKAFCTLPARQDMARLAALITAVEELLAAEGEG